MKLQEQFQPSKPVAQFSYNACSETKFINNSETYTVVNFSGLTF